MKERSLVVFYFENIYINLENFSIHLNKISLNTLIHILVRFNSIHKRRKFENVGVFCRYLIYCWINTMNLNAFCYKSCCLIRKYSYDFAMYMFKENQGSESKYSEAMSVSFPFVYINQAFRDYKIIYTI